jgi:hypothetical protein
MYARYSGDKQDPRSIADQFLYCRDFADRQVGWKIVAEYQDAEITGETLLLRPGGRHFSRLRGVGSSTSFWSRT